MRRGQLQQGGVPSPRGVPAMGRTSRVAALATTAAMGAATLALATGSSTASTQIDAASRAVEYLQRQQSGVNGSIPLGPSTVSVSAEYAIGAAAAGYDPKALRHGSGPSVMAYLRTQTASACASAGGCGLLIQAVVAAHLNPSAFGGADLLTLLAGLYHPATGVYGDGEAFTQSLAVQGLVAAGQTVPAAAIHHLAAAQDSDGGWDFLLIKDDPNAGTDFDSSDTNSTAMVLMALDAAGIRGHNAAALAWLHTQQDSDGGFPYQAGAGTDPDSTALVLQALVGAGQNPDGATWAVAGHTPLASLIATQDGDGGYTFPGGSGPDVFTTVQVPPALDRAAYPVRAVFPVNLTPASEEGAATSALKYLQRQQSGVNGSIPLGPSTVSVSAEYAIGAAAAGYDPKALRHGSGPSVMAYLRTQTASACASAGGCGLLIQAVVAAHLNPSAFGGADLLTLLAGLYHPATGVYGDGEAFTQSLAVQGLVAAGQTVPAAAIHHLAAAQDSDGGWDFLLIKDDPNAGTDFDSSDTNSTAMVLMALDAAGIRGHNAAALAWLHTQQDSDGGFPYQAGAGTDPDSTALVLQALVGAGQNPDGATWAVAGHTPLASLIATQDGDGGYTFPGGSGPDVFTTVQVPPALDRAAYPLACGSAPCFKSGAVVSAVRLGSSPA